MNKLLVYLLSAMLALSLCACAATGGPESPELPQSMPDVESIVEPVTGDEPSAASEWEVEAETAYPGSVADVPALYPEPSEPVIAVPEPAASQEPQVANPEAAEPLSELLEALAPDFRLDCGAIEKELLRLINSLREEEGVHALGMEDSLQFAARIRAAEAYESFSHTRPDGTPYTTAFEDAGFSYSDKWHGENLSSVSCSARSLQEEEIALKMFNGLKDSPGHYRNMTEKHFVQTGIGVAATYTDGIIDITSAQMFSSL